MGHVQNTGQHFVQSASINRDFCLEIVFRELGRSICICLNISTKVQWDLWKYHVYEYDHHQVHNF